MQSAVPNTQSTAVWQYSYNDLTEQKRDFYIIICVVFAGYTLLIWDHMLTFSDEVELIWKARKTFMSYLFLLNRYLIPLGSAFCFYPYLCPTLTDLECRAYMRYEGYMVAFGLVIVGLMMLRRLVALYGDYHAVVFIGGMIFMTWISTGLFVVSSARAVPHSQTVYACSQISRGKITSAVIWLLVAFDSFAVGAILARTLPFRPHRNMRTIARALTVDGLMYYIIVLTVNIIHCIIIVEAPNGLKNVFGQLKLQLTVTMMSRITLNLPKQHRRLTLQPTSRPWQDAPSMLPTIHLSTAHHTVEPEREQEAVQDVELQPVRPLGAPSVCPLVRTSEGE